LLNRGIHSGSEDSLALEVVDCKERNNKEDNDASEGPKRSAESINRSEVTVLPNDVCGLSSLDHSKVISQKLLLRWLLGPPEIVLWLKLFSYNLTIFFLEGDESVNRANKIIKISILVLHDFFFNFSSFIVFLLHNMLSTKL
jgi:hypothetical protein